MNWMLSEAIEQLSRAERMHRQFFSLTAAAESRGSTWEPPIDVIETNDEVLIFVALPGVDPGGVEAVIADGILSSEASEPYPRNCATRASTGSNCRRVISSAASRCRPAAATSAASRPTAASFSASQRRFEAQDGFRRK